MRSLTFRAMGSPCRLVVDGGGQDAIDAAKDLVDDLERQWSRFHPTSEVSQVNANAGHFSIVSRNTFELVSRAVDARLLTRGRFNPLMLGQLCALGYDRSWQDGQPMAARRHPIERVPGCLEPIDLVPEALAVRIPTGTAFDPGGIGKGLAVDIVTDFLLRQGATTTSVELGGDLRVTGDPWFGDTWRIGVADPIGTGGEIAVFRPSEGAVATSSRLRRRWLSEQGEVHHLLDPLTGAPATTDVVAVTTCSASAWWAEVVAKVVLIEGSFGALALLDALGTPGLIVTADGQVQTSAPVAEPAGREREAVSA